MLRRVVGNGLRVIAGRGGDQSALLFLGSQRQDAVERPSFLVGSGSLQVFKFQKDGIPRLRRKCLRAPAGRDKNRVPNPLARLAYLFEGHHENPSYYTSTSGGDARNTTFFSLSMESVAARPECGALRATTRLLRREELGLLCAGRTQRFQRGKRVGHGQGAFRKLLPHFDRLRH